MVRSYGEKLPQTIVGPGNMSNFDVIIMSKLLIMKENIYLY
jgi:hypothetical protein